MKILFSFLFIFLMFVSLSCTTESIPEQETIEPQNLGDDTPFIMGILEATYDTVHHHPELVAGFVNNVDGYINPNSLDTIEVFNPTLWTQVVNTSKLFHLTFTPDNEAFVSVTGPLGGPGEKKVEYSNTGNGVYGDTGFELEIVPEGIYRLEVLFSDGRTYRGNTTIPHQTAIEVPDSIGLRVDYAPYNDGSAREENPDSVDYYIPVEYPENSSLALVQSNSNRDRETLLLEDYEYFKFNERGPYLRDGSMYHISKTNSPVDSLRRSWWQDLYDKRKEDVWHSRHFWMTFSFFSEDIGNIFHPMVDMYSSKGEAFDDMMDEFVENFEARNPSYLLDVSTIQKVNEDGEILSQSETDAVGFFAGYFSVYRTTTLYPLRTFDLDSVLMNNRVYNPDP